MPEHVIYARKSTESEDRQVLSIDSQVNELRLLALRRGIEVGDILTEAHSAKAPGRPVFEQLMRRVDKGQVASILCWKLDRLARNHADTGRVLQALADRKIESVITVERTYTGDGNDRFMGNFELGMATKFIDDLRANIKRGNRARYERGWPTYRPPIGYLEDRPNKTVIKDPERFDLVRRMWDLLLSGAMRPSRIAKVANEEWGLRTHQSSYPAGNPIQIPLVYKIFGNPFYMGVLRHRRSGESRKGAFPAMVTPEEFAKAQQILGRPGRPRPSKHEFAYAGMLRCGRCGHLLTGEVHTKPSGKRYLYYRCRSHPGGQYCRNPVLREDVLENQVLEDLRRLAATKEAARWIVDNLRATLGGDIAQLKTARESLRSALQAAEREWDALVTLKLRGQIDDQTFERRRLELEDRKTDLRVKLDQPESTAEQLVDRAEEILDFCRTAPAAFLKAGNDPVGRRVIVEAVSSNWRADSGKCLYQATEPFSFLARAGPSQHWSSIVEDLRTWLLKVGDFRLPDLKAAAPYVSGRVSRER